MPLTHVRAFRVRLYECDLCELLRSASYLRYLQETAFDASAAAGFGPPEYLAMKRMWLIRETSLAFSGILRFGDTVEVKTWVQDFRRVRSRRAYRLSRQGTGELIARGYSDWAFLEIPSGRPALVPDNLIAAFFPEGPPAGAQPRERFPAVEMPANAFTTRRPVAWRDLDSAGHVNNANYQDYLDESLRQFLGSLGWPTTRLTAEGIALAPRQLRIEYRQPALPDEHLEITIGLATVEPDHMVQHGTVSRLEDGELLARAVHRWAIVDPTSGVSQSLPVALLQDLLAHENR